ncbi:MAG: hypothetical protein U5L96_12875 [Owenweeksia sp.]|nr:hypothetical protein [Owenweeksia sp.]
MRRIILSYLAFFIVGLGTVNASFPVKKSNNSDSATETTTAKTNSSEDMVLSAQEQMGKSIERIDKVEKTSEFF